MPRGGSHFIHMYVILSYRYKNYTFDVLIHDSTRVSTRGRPRDNLADSRTQPHKMAGRSGAGYEIVLYPDPIPAAILFSPGRWVWYIYDETLDHDLEIRRPIRLHDREY